MTALARRADLSAPDLIDDLAGLDPSSGLGALRRERPAAVEAIEGSRAALLASEASAIPVAERAAVARHVAERDGAAALAERYAALSPAPADSPRLDAMLRHARLLLAEPDKAEPKHLRALEAAGLSARDIVVISQLIAFVTFETRLLAGLRALAGEAGPSGGEVGRSKGNGFTLDELAWESWIETVSLDAATPDQIRVLEESNPKAKTSPYYLTLVHEPEALRQRSKLFNTVMYGPRGLPRAERELAAVAESRINGCPYCASVHARLFAQLTKEPEAIQRVLDEGVSAPLDGRRRVIVDYAAALAASPPAVSATHLQALRKAGLSDGEILDATQVVAMFAWANRLMQTLGAPAGVVG
jgi:uncharacterized peroxidase-related enzyme